MAANFVFYEEQFRGGYRETLQTEEQRLAQGLGDAISVTIQNASGEVTKESYFRRMNNTVNRLDLGASGNVSTINLTEDDIKIPHLYRRVGPFSVRDIDLVRRDVSSQTYSSILGSQVAEDTAVDYVTSGINALVGSALSTTELRVKYQDASNNYKKMDYDALINGIEPFGDQSSDVNYALMHSKPFFQLMRESLDIQGTDVPGGIIYDGRVGTAGLNVFVVDSDALKILDGSNNTIGYRTLCLRSNALEIEEIFSPSMKQSTDVLDVAGPAVSMAGIHGLKVKPRGYSYEDGAGNTTKNPDASQLLDPSNWQRAFTEPKDSACSIIETGL